MVPSLLYLREVHLGWCGIAHGVQLGRLLRDIGTTPPYLYLFCQRDKVSFLGPQLGTALLLLSSLASPLLENPHLGLLLLVLWFSDPLVLGKECIWDIFCSTSFCEPAQVGRGRPEK